MNRRPSSISALQALRERCRGLRVLFAEDNLVNREGGADLLAEAVRRRDERCPRLITEASGGVTLDTVRAIAETGVDRVSVGGLTHQAVSLDLGLDAV